MGADDEQSLLSEGGLQCVWPQHTHARRSSPPTGSCTAGCVRHCPFQHLLQPRRKNWEPAATTAQLLSAAAAGASQPTFEPEHTPHQPPTRIFPPSFPRCLPTLRLGFLAGRGVCPRAVPPGARGGPLHPAAHPGQPHVDAGQGHRVLRAGAHQQEEGVTAGQREVSVVCMRRPPPTPWGQQPSGPSSQLGLLAGAASFCCRSPPPRPLAAANTPPHNRHPHRSGPLPQLLLLLRCAFPSVRLGMLARA